jgi:hypothetical protein
VRNRRKEGAGLARRRPLLASASHESSHPPAPPRRGFCSGHRLTSAQNGSLGPFGPFRRAQDGRARRPPRLRAVSTSRSALPLSFSCKGELRPAGDSSSSSTAEATPRRRALLQLAQRSSAALHGTFEELPTLPDSDVDALLARSSGSMSRAPSRPSRCVLRAPGRPVDLDRYALREGSRVDQVKRDVRAGVGE